MASTQPTSDARGGKNRRTRHSEGRFSIVTNRAVANGASSHPLGATSSTSLERTIELERERLSNAQSILGCLHAAMLSAEQGTPPEPGCADVVAAAMRLIREAIHRLDYLHLQPLLDAQRAAPGKRPSVCIVKHSQVKARNRGSGREGSRHQRH